MMYLLGAILGMLPAIVAVIAYYKGFKDGSKYTFYELDSKRLTDYNKD